MGLWNFFGTSLELLWNFLGTSLELLWNFFGTSLELLWNFFGTSLKLLWNLNLCYLTFKSDIGQHSQFLRCFLSFSFFKLVILLFQLIIMFSESKSCFKFWV